MTLTVEPGPLVVAVVVIAGSAFLFGVLIGGEAQKRILRGHEGTRADKLRRLRAQRAAAIARRRIELYGPPPTWAIPEPRSPVDDDDRWWRRHPGGEAPIRRSSNDGPPELHGP